MGVKGVLKGRPTCLGVEVGSGPGPATAQLPALRTCHLLITFRVPGPSLWDCCPKVTSWGSLSPQGHLKG